MLEGLDPALARIAEAVEAAKNLCQAVVGGLRIAAPRSVTTYLLLPLVLEFRAKFPQITVELHADDSLQDIVAAWFDFGIRFGDVLEQDMIATAIGAPTRLLVIASPDYVRANGLPESPGALHGYDFLGRRFPSGSLFGLSFAKAQEQRTFTPDAALMLVLVGAGHWLCIRRNSRREHRGGPSRCGAARLGR